MVRKSVLFVDDSAFFRKRMHDALGSLDYDVFSVNDGAEAVDWIERNPPVDVVITDLHMPHLDGVGLIGRCAPIAPIARHRSSC